MGASEPTFLKSCGYSATKLLARLAGVTACQIRCVGRERVPREGSVLICANHQSYFDPVLMGLACDRPMNYLARKSLFRFPPFRWLIEFYNAIPLDRDGSGLSGIKETLRRLKKKQMVLIFPEGTRTHNGEVAPLKSGFCALARRGKATLVPAGIDGAYDVWPRNRYFPSLAPIQIHFGEPIDAETVAGMDDEALTAELERRIRECHAQARQARLRR